MKTDLYTKVILTIIAVSLVVIVIQNMNISLVSPAYATPPPSAANVVDVNLVSVDGSRIGTYNAIPVKVQNTPKVEIDNRTVDVNVKNAVEIKTGYSGLDVTVKNYRDFK